MAASLASILAAVAAFVVAALLLVRGELLGSLDSALRDRAQVVAQLAVSAPAVLSSSGGLESPVSGRQLSVEVLDAHERILARSLTLGSRLLPVTGVARSALAAGSPGFQNVKVGGRPFRLYAAPIAQAGGPASGGVVLVASDTSDISRTLHHLAVVLVLSGVAVAALAALMAAALTRRGLRSLRRLAAGAREIERTGDPLRRLAPPSPAHQTDEIAQLTEVLNRMLDSLERSRESERRFLADASHELRTPVTSLLGNVEYAAARGADPELLEELRRDARRLARLVDDLLVLEREGAAGVQLEPLSLDELVVDAAEAFDPDRVRVVTDGELVVRGDRDALRRVLVNLVENALVHGPERGLVTVHATAEDGWALLRVSDEGPGPAAAERERLFERFWRGREAAARPGSGLGLSIVAATARRHGGSVAVDGSAFTVRLPLAAGPVRGERAKHDSHASLSKR